MCFDNAFGLLVSEVFVKRKAPGVKGTESLTCARKGIRTPNLLIRSQMLYPLSYARLLNCLLRMRINSHKEEDFAHWITIPEQSLDEPTR